MTWNSGSCDTPPPGASAAYFSETAGIIRIPDAESDDDERDRLAALADDELAPSLRVVRPGGDPG